jgi:transcriptional regulator with XRE-family HTH domain
MTYDVMVLASNRPYARRMPARVHAGPLLREWRTRRRLSQLDLSTRTGVSTRHLSCVETGRAKPSRDLLLYLADELEMPQRATNELLLAAGFAPVFSHLNLDDDAMARVRTVVRHVLDGNDPNPTTVIDTRWNVIDANAAAFWFCGGVAAELLAWPINVARLSLHPDGLAPRIANFNEFAGQLLRHMHHTLTLTHDPQLAALIEECERYAPHVVRSVPVVDDVVLPVRVVVDDEELSFFSTITTFGAARDVTLSELSIETLYPGDDVTRRVLASRPWTNAREPELSGAA